MASYATDNFPGDSATVEFTLTFPYISRDHVDVYLIENADQSETKLTVIETGVPTASEYIWESDKKIKVGVAPTTDQTLRIQRDTPEDEQIVQWADGSYLTAEDLNDSDLQWLYGLQELEDKFSLLDSTALKYLGVIDLTVDVAPATPEGGDFYINSGSGVVVSSWTGIAGDTVTGSEQVIYNSALSEWQIIETPASQQGVLQVLGTAPIQVDATDTQRPVVSIADATPASDGAMSAADKAKLDGIAPGATVGIPDAPSDGDQYARKDAAWSVLDVPPETVVSPTPPPNPVESQFWYDSTDGRTYVYYTDADSSQWVESNPSWNGSIADDSVSTAKLQDGSVTPAKLDRAYVEAADEKWSRTGTTLSPATAGDDISTTGVVYASNLPTQGQIVGYQQGLWIPTMTYGTNTNNPANNYWTRIGNMVTVNGYLNDWTDFTTDSGMGIEGRPYAWAISQVGGACMGTRVAVSISTVFLGNDGTMTFYESSSSAGAPWIQMKHTNTNAASQVQFKVSYLTDDTTWTPINGATVS